METNFGLLSKEDNDLETLKRRYYGLGEYAGESYNIIATDQNIEFYDKPYKFGD